MRSIKIVLTALALSACSSDRAELLSYGIVDNVTIETEINEDLLSGNKHIINSWNLVKTTTDIPNKLGIEFGIAYELVTPFYRNSALVEEVMVFPGNGLTNPDTGKSAKQDVESLVINSSEEQYFSYTFDWYGPRNLDTL